MIPQLSRQTGFDARPIRLECLASLCLTLVLLVFWPLLHRYKGLSGDAELYAGQALSRLNPGLAADIFLRNNSQDRYTLFSPLYAWCIGGFGLRNAALTLTVVFKLSFFAAGWALARSLFDTRAAFIATGFLIVVAGSYGAAGVFSYAEDWLTARTLGEALVVAALWLTFREATLLAIPIFTAALLMHPLMALPGLLLVLAARVPPGVGIAAAAGALFVTVGIALAAGYYSTETGPFTVMDPEWLEVVRERSVFLFPHLWQAADWKDAAQPFLSLIVSGLAITDSKIRRIVWAAALVGVTGLAVALVAGKLGPVALLLQGQAWRWMWITRFMAVLLLAPTIISVWNDSKCGALCAVLLTLGWTFLAIDGPVCIALALALWAMRTRVTDRLRRLFRFAAVVVGAIAAVWVVAAAWGIMRTPPPESGREPAVIAMLRNLFGLGVMPMVLIAALGHWLTTRPPILVLTAATAALLLCCGFLYPAALRSQNPIGSAAQLAQFADWRRAIPPTATVFVTSARISPAFVWFNLQRPSYLTIDQSSGVVFSRATSLEVKRRAEVLLPLMKPDWKLLSGSVSLQTTATPDQQPALTRESLVHLCHDTALNFVIAKEELGFDPIRHLQADGWSGFNLYDCGRVNRATHN